MYVLAGLLVDLVHRVSITVILCSAATDDKVVVRDSVSCVEAVVLIAALENVCALLAPDLIVAVTAVHDVIAYTAPLAVIAQTAEERVGTRAADFLVVFCEAPDHVVAAQAVQLVQS